MIRWDAYPVAPVEPFEEDGQPGEIDPDFLAPPGRVARLAFDATGQVLVSMPQYDGIIRPPLVPATLWRPDGTRVTDLPVIPLAATPTAVAVGPGGAWVAVGLTDTTPRRPPWVVEVWEPSAGRLLARWSAEADVADLRPLPDGGLLATTGEVFLLPPGLAGDPTPLGLVGPADVARVAVGDGWLAGASKTRATVWDAAGERVADREFKKGPQFGPVAFRPHSTVLAVGHGTVVDLWDFQTGAEVVLKGHKRPVWAVGFTPDGGTAYTAASDGAVMAWEADTGAVRQRFDFGTGKLYAAAVAPDGLTVAVGTHDGRILVWDL